MIRMTTAMTAGLLLAMATLASLAATPAAAIKRTSSKPATASKPLATKPVATTTSAPAAVSVRVDRRVELMCIVYRLAGNPEYNQPTAHPAYAATIDKHFAKFKDHDVVKLARQMRAKRGVSFDAPMSLAVHLDEQFKPAFTQRPGGLDGRYDLDEARRFCALLQDFARRSEFETFFKDHAKLYRLAEGRLSALIESQVDVAWFGRYFRPAAAPRFHVVIALLNGGCCYGPRVEQEGAMETYCILGNWERDGDGMPTFSKQVLPTLVHEFCHSFVTPVVLAQETTFAAPADAVYEQVKVRMKRMAYGNAMTMAHESVVRACVVRYLEHKDGPAAARKELASQYRMGFWCTPGIARQLAGDYEKSPDQYKTFADFSPKLADSFLATARKLQATSQPAK